jgi:hypothetical protein
MSANGKTDILTPQQERFLAYYTDPSSETYSNATQSALKAGYAQEYSENITWLMPEWLSERIGDMKLLRKAEKRLNQLLDLEPVDVEGKVDNQLIANQMKGITLVAKGLGKNKYSERQEHTGKDGEKLQVVVPLAVADAFNLHAPTPETRGSDTE